MWVGVIQSNEDLKRTKKQKLEFMKEKSPIPGSYAFGFWLHSSTEFLGSTADFPAYMIMWNNSL